MTRFYVFILALQFGMTTLFAQERSEPHQTNELQFINLFDSSQPGIGCYRIPALLTAQNGDLIAAIDQRVQNCGDLRGNRDINIVIRRSLDNGRT